MDTTDERQMLAFFLPEGPLEYFELSRGTKTAHAIHLVREEKNHPPLVDAQPGQRVWAKGFQDSTITDCPARGRPGSRTFRRRRWQVEGEPSLLKRDMALTAPGTQLATECAAFLKARGCPQAAGLGHDCRGSFPGCQGGCAALPRASQRLPHVGGAHAGRRMARVSGERGEALAP